MSHKFIILKDGKKKTYSKYEDIPPFFDNVIEFCPKIPDGPHTDEQHAEIHAWEHRFKELLAREKM